MIRISFVVNDTATTEIYTDRHTLSLHDSHPIVANYATSSKSFSSYLGILISETDGIRVGLGISSNKVNLFQGYSPRTLIDYQNQIGNKTIHTWTGTLGWNHDTRNGYWAPTRGGLLSRSEEHTSELQSLMRISYAVFCLKKKTKTTLS